MIKFLTLLFFTLGILNSPVYAGGHSPALGKCLIASTTLEDRNKLIMWAFSATAQHPAVKNMVNISEAQLAKINKNFADLSMRLLTQDCRVEAKKAMRNGGQLALQNSFRVFAEVAGKQLFSSPQVAKAMLDSLQYLNLLKLGKAFM